mgnify:CR=1 FL=1
MKRAVVCGAGGFIGGHLVRRLKDEGYWVRGVDLKYPEYDTTAADEFIIRDLCLLENCREVVKSGAPEPFDEIYQLAADMGGAGFVFTGDNDADIMHNSAAVNLNMLHALHEYGTERDWLDRTKIFYSCSACMYPEYAQTDSDNPGLKESDAYPAAPDSEYGWEKLFSERMYLAYGRNYGIPVRVARFHNIFGPLGTWDGGREKAPAAMCRKIAACPDGGEIEIWGDGEQTRSFLYVTECVEGIRRLMESDWTGPVNIGSDELVSINQMVNMIADIAGKKITKLHIPGPVGIRGRNSENTLIKEQLGWAPDYPLVDGLKKSYPWIKQQVENAVSV